MTTESISKTDDAVPPVGDTIAATSKTWTTTVKEFFNQMYRGIDLADGPRFIEVRRINPEGECPCEFHAHLDSVLEEIPKQKKGIDCYYGVHVRDEPAGTREAVSWVATLHADLDFKYHPYAEWTSILKNFKLPATVVVSTGHGLHGYWFLEKPIHLKSEVEKAHFEAVQLGLQKHFGVDHTHDLPRILRIPGTVNYKDLERPIRSEVLFADFERTHKLADFEKFLSESGDNGDGSKGLAAPIDDQIIEGGRNTALASLAGSIRRPGMSMEEIEAALLVANQNRCKPPLPDAEVRKIAQSIGRYAPAPFQPSVSPTFQVQEWNEPTPWPELEKEASQTTSDRKPEPRPLQRALPDPAPYPMDALGITLGPAAKTFSDVVQAPPAICGNSLVAAAAAAVQGHANLIIDGRESPCSEYLVTVGCSGERKSAVDRLALRPHWDYQKELQKVYETAMHQYEVEYAAWEQQKKECLRKKDLLAKQTALKDLGPPPVAPLKPILFAEEPTYEGMVKLFEIGRPALGLFSDEGGRFLGGYAMGKDHQIKTAAGLSSLWDGRPVSRVRASDGSQVLYGRRLSAHLMVQPRIGLDLLSNPDLVDQGILSRFLVTYPATTAGTRFYRPVDVNEVPAYRKYRERMTAILETPLPTEPDQPNQLIPRRVPLSSEAKEAWIAFHDAVERKLVDGGALGPVRSLANKAPEHVARLACILTLVEDLSAPEIQLGAIKAGIELVSHFLNEALRLLDVGNVNSELDDAQRLLDWFIKRGEPEVSLVEIYQRGPNCVREADKARSLMRILEDHDWVFPLDHPVEFDGSMRSEGWGINL